MKDLLRSFTCAKSLVHEVTREDEKKALRKMPKEATLYTQRQRKVHLVLSQHFTKGRGIWPSHWKVEGGTVMGVMTVERALWIELTKKAPDNEAWQMTATYPCLGPDRHSQLMSLMSDPGLRELPGKEDVVWMDKSTKLREIKFFKLGLDVAVVRKPATLYVNDDLMEFFANVCFSGRHQQDFMVLPAYAWHEITRNNPMKNKPFYDRKKKWRMNPFPPQMLVLPCNEIKHWFLVAFCNLRRAYQLPGGGSVGDQSQSLNPKDKGVAPK